MDQRQEFLGPFGAQPLDHGVLVVARGGVHGDERRLVDHEQVLVLIQNRQGRLVFGVFEGQPPERDALFGTHALARATPPPLRGIRAVLDDQPRARAARAAQLGLHEAVQTHAGELAGHAQDAQDGVFGYAFWADDR